MVVIVVDGGDVVVELRRVVLVPAVVAVVEGLGRVVDDAGGSVVVVVGRIWASARGALVHGASAKTAAHATAAATMRSRVTALAVRGW